MCIRDRVETDQLWGHGNDPVNFHRSLQDFDHRLPELLAHLREGDLLVLTSDHGCDPTTPGNEHTREYELLLAYVEGTNAAGRIYEGEPADVGATVNAWLGGRAPAQPGVDGRADVGRLAFVDAAGGVRALDVGEQKLVLARVLVAGGGRVATVVGGEHEQIALAQMSQQLG